MIRKPVVIMEKELITHNRRHRIIVERMMPMRTGISNRHNINNFLQLIQDQGLQFDPRQLDISLDMWDYVGDKHVLYRVRWLDASGNDFVFQYFIIDAKLLGGLDVDGSTLYSMQYWFDYSRKRKTSHAIRMSVMTNSKNELIQSLVQHLEEVMLEIAQDVETYKHTMYADLVISTREQIPRVKTDRTLITEDYMVNLPAPVPEYRIH